MTVGGLMDWFMSNYQWIFSGVGVAVLGWLFVRQKSRHSVQQNVNDSSNIAQIGGNVSIGSDHDGTKR